MTDAIFTHNIAFTLPTTNRLLVTSEIFLVFTDIRALYCWSDFIHIFFFYNSEVYPRLRVRLGIRLGLEILA